MRVTLSPSRIEDYRTFLAVKGLPRYQFQGRTAIVPDEYAAMLGGVVGAADSTPYEPIPGLFDYQRDIAGLSIRKRKFAVFAEPGLGKTLMLLEYARHVQRVLGPTRRALIVCPLMVVRQTMNEAERFYANHPNPPRLVQVRAAELSRWVTTTGGEIGMTNYDAINSSIEPGRLGALILDECFPAGTMVDCLDDTGNPFRKHIENCVVGDKIINASGTDRVIATHKREIKYAVHVKVGAGITCSPNHPFFTQRGWVCAQDLEPGDSISLASEAVRMVRDGLYASQIKSGVGAVLRSILLSEMEDEPGRAQSQGSYTRSSRANREEEGGVVPVGQSHGQERTGPNCGTQSCNRPGGPGQDFADPSRNEARTFRAWGQWPWVDGSAKDPDGCVGRRLDSGVCLVVGPKDSRLSLELQTRLGESRAKSRYRGGWSLPSKPKGDRPEEGCQIGFARVEGLEVLEPGHPELERFRDADGKLYFYDFEAERHPSFSVNGLLVHNSSMLKSHYGKWGNELIRLGKGLDWKLCLTGTPAPNDPIEFASHAVFLDAFPTVNSFLARFFVNRGQTGERWEMKAHARMPFYKALSHWCIFLSNPATYGWKDNAGSIPPIHVHIHDVGLSREQEALIAGQTGTLFANEIGGITSRSVLSQIAKGSFQGQAIETLKPHFIKVLVESWRDRESTIIWCKYNAEQDGMTALFPDAASIDGSTPYERRVELIGDFQAGRRRILVSKGVVLGFGLNLQIATRMVFSGIDDSYETYFQCVKRANRVGSTLPLNVHVPVTDVERPMLENVLRKAANVERDTRAVEELFRGTGYQFRVA